jgi:hypothetical protein
MPEGSSRTYICNCARYCRGEARVVKKSVYYAHAVHRRILPPLQVVDPSDPSPIPVNSSNPSQDLDAGSDSRPLLKRARHDGQPSALSYQNVSGSTDIITV